MQEKACDIRIGFAYAAVGICSLIVYPIGALLLKTKCGSSCFPTVSDVERPLANNEVFTVDVVRRILVTSSVFLRVILVPIMLLQIFPLIKSPRFSSMTSRFLEIAFYASLSVWIISDIFQVAIGNSLEHRADYTPHTIAIHVDIIALIICHMVLLIALYNDAESGQKWLGVGAFAIVKVCMAALFLATFLSTTSSVWQLVEWGMLGAIGGLHTSVGLAMPASLKMNMRHLQVTRHNTARMIPDAGSANSYDSMQQNL